MRRRIAKRAAPPRRTVDAARDDRTPEKRAPAKAEALKATAVTEALRLEETRHHDTRDARGAWRYWQLARQMKRPIPEWVLAAVDPLVATQLEVPSKRNIETADNYAAALMQMDVAVAAHHHRVRIRDVSRQLGASVTISRRDRPNLTAIARAAAEANGISVNRLLARYRTHQKTTKR